MRALKRLDFFLLKSFFPLFIMTFGICLFIFLMQFLWMYIDEMVGKGIEIHILLQLFFYAAMRFVPQALPLAILFASLMTFGNLGEQYELLAMKASGISLMRIMKPLTVFLVFISISAFYFQDYIIPASQIKFYTLFYSVRQKSPELEIPVGVFSNVLPNKNIYVGGKDRKKKLLTDIFIYDYTEGFNNARVITADSGRIQTSTDKMYLVLTLYSGESFGNLNDNSNNRTRQANDPSQYRSETFDSTEMLIEYDGNLNMRSEDQFRDRHVGKNLVSLQRSIDSMTVRLDSIKEEDSMAIFGESYRRSLEPYAFSADKPEQEQEIKSPKVSIQFDSLFNVQDDDMKASLLRMARDNTNRIIGAYGIKSNEMRVEDKEIRWHHIEMHKKFTLSFACLVFFFIGAPLGAIIRKGGLGAPAVISVFLFIVYYIIDNSGYKLARDGVWLPWQGMWISSAVLLPLGVFFTFKAVIDSVLFNAETYTEIVKRIIGKYEYRKIEMKELIIERADYNEVRDLLQQLKTACQQYLVNNKRWLHYVKFWKSGGADPEMEKIGNQVEEVVEMLRDSDQTIILNKVMDFPVFNNYRMTNFQISDKVGMALAIIFPIGGIVYLIACYRRKLLNQDMHTTVRVCEEMTKLIEDLDYEV